MTPIQLEINRAVLITIFNARWFNIGHLDGAIRASNLMVNPELYNKFLALHGVQYAHMTGELRKWLFEMCYKILLNHSTIESLEGEWVKNFIEG